MFSLLRAPRSTPPRRGDVLRAVSAAADRRRDGVLPTDVPGVAATFRDELDLLGALQLRWYARLSGRIEREQVRPGRSLEDAVVAAWRATAAELPGVRAVLDRHREHPLDEPMASAMAKATGKEHVMLAVMAGRGSTHSQQALRAAADEGARIESLARTPAERSLRVG